MLDHGIGVYEDDKFVLVKHLVDHVRLNPGIVVTFDVACVEEFVVIAVDLSFELLGEGRREMRWRLTVKEMVDKRCS